jgi:hypothetical protein
MAKILGIICSTSQKEINYLESLVILLVLVGAVFGLLNFNSFNSLCTVYMLESGSFATDGLADSNLFHTCLSMSPMSSKYPCLEMSTSVKESGGGKHLTVSGLDGEN